MLEIKLPLRALSLNKAWRGGARYRSKDYIEFEREVLYLLPRNTHIDGEVQIDYKFFLKNRYSNSDVSNLVKCLEDILVRADIITDDCLVKRFSAEKIKSEVDKIEIEIISYDKNKYIKII